MAERPAEPERLDSWKDIASYLGRNVRTAMRWEQGKGLPVHRVPGGHRQAVYAWIHEINDWLKNGHLELDDHGDDSGEPPQFDAAIHEATNGPIITPSLDHPIVDSAKPSPHISRWSSVSRTTLVAALLVILTIGAYALRSLVFPHEVRFSGVTQVTNDGALKLGLVTDGRNLYFGEDRNGRISLSSVSVEGGPIRSIYTPFAKATPVDISPDGTELLVLGGEGEEDERALWIVPLSGGQPHRVGAVLCHAAAWSPNGRKIAFAAHNGVYITTDEGVSVREIQTFGSVPGSLRWTADGNRLRFDLQDAKNQVCSFWEISFSNSGQSQVSSIASLNSELSNCMESRLTLDRQGRSFVEGSVNEARRIYLLQKQGSLWNNQFAMFAIKNEIDSPSDLALDSRSERLFVVGASAATPDKAPRNVREDLIEFDVGSHSFRPFLPEISAEYVDFSRDGQRMAYVRAPDFSLWVSQADGRAASKVEFIADDLELPRWSPDGKWIAFTAKVSGRPYRIFVVPTSGGTPREVSVGTDSQGAPTWSPDSRWLVYGNVNCQETGACAIHKIDFSTGQVQIVPESEGLGTARWSPDGRFIAALSPEKRQVLVFNEASMRWRKLADDVNGNDLSWSSDSRYLFASEPSSNLPKILRISVKDGTADTAVDLSSFAKWSGRIDTWFTLTPTRSIIFRRGISTVDIYALSYEDR